MKTIKIEQEFPIPGTDVVVEKGDTIRVREDRQLHLPLLTVIVHGGRVYGYSKEDLEELADISTEADNVPGWMLRAFVLGSNKKNKLYMEIKNLSISNDFEYGIKALLEHISLGNPAVINVNSEQNYREANLIWLRPM